MTWEHPPAVRHGEPDVTTPEGITLAHRLQARGWTALELVLPHGYARLWVCPTCSAAVLDVERHLEVLPHPHEPDLLADVAQRRTPEQWCAVAGVTIVDPDGWRGPAGRPWTDRITRGEFDRRAALSTIDDVRKRP